MNPFDHARSSATIHGGLWGDYHPLHCWFDETKATLAHFTHRALRHHVEGIDEAMRIFGPTVVNADGKAVSVANLGRQHMIEDCRRVPDASEWVENLRLADWMPTVDAAKADDMAALSARRFGGTAETYLPLHRWFLATRAWVDGPEHLLFRHHAFGIFEAEALLGPVLSDGTTTIPTRVVAERHVQSVIGRIPAAADWLRRIKGAKWMLQATNAKALGLDGHRTSAEAT